MNRPLWKACEEVCLAGLCKKTNIRVAVLLAACLSPILAFAQNDNWLGGTGLWSDATKWSAGVPTSSNSVFIDNGKAGASPVTINFNGAQCANLTIDSDDSLTLVDGTIFTLYGPTISNAGNIFLNSAGFGLDFNFGGAVTLTGAGTLTMSNILHQRHHGLRSAVPRRLVDQQKHDSGSRRGRGSWRNRQRQQLYQPGERLMRTKRLR